MIVFVQDDDGLLPMLGSSHRRSGPTGLSFAGRRANIYNFDVVNFLNRLARRAIMVVMPTPPLPLIAIFIGFSLMFLQ